MAPHVHPHSFQLHDAARRALGDTATDEMVAVIQADGDCEQCHAPLGATAPIAVHVTRFSTGTVVAAPRHAVHGLPTWTKVTGPATPPTQTFRTMSALVSHAQELAVFVTPSVDVQVGRVSASGHWVPEAVDDADVIGLQPVNSFTAALPRTWGARFSQPDVLRVESPVVGYDVQLRPDEADAARRAGGARIFVVPTHDVLELEVGGLALVNQLAAQGRLLAAYATLGSAPARRSLYPEADIPAPPPHGMLITDTDQLRDIEADVTCMARALFTTDPVLRDAGGPRGARQPVLLLEPPRSVLGSGPDGTPRDMRVEAAITGGLTRWTGGRAPNTPARDWTLYRTDGELMLTAPYEQATARAQIDHFPPGWLSAAATGSVLVMYGPLLGVRANNSGTYDDRARARELTESRRTGLACWGLVPLAE